MSISGIRSSRGDSYQILVALDWALTVLSDPDYLWIEIDSIAWPVDDIVIGKRDGSIICCQCKKNQTNFDSWTITNLAGELEKATALLASNPTSEVRFYSRSPFGDIHKLREHSSTQDNLANYQASLSKELQRIDSDLAVQIAKRPQALSTFEFLRRTLFITTDEMDRMAALLRERLRAMVSESDLAFEVLWARLDQLGAHIPSEGISSASTQHRLTKRDIEEVLNKAGVLATPLINLAEIRGSFAQTSSIGRSWRRDIAGLHLTNPVLDELHAAIDSRAHMVLLTGTPGSGKTCVMLELQDSLERLAKASNNIVPLFIQAREFSDITSAHERQAQGLQEQWVENVARMAEEAQVVVTIDSLDVLSISRRHTVLKYFLAQIDRLRLIQNVTVITACREFDRHYDRRIAAIKWDREFRCPPLNWESQVIPLLNKLGIEPSELDTTTRDLILNPRELELFAELARRTGVFNIVTSHALAQRYLDTFVQADDSLGDQAMQAIEGIADEMLRTRSLSVPPQHFNAPQDIRRALLSLNVVRETQDGGITFGHQTLLDVLVVSGAMRQRVSLSDFIRSLPPVPFVRPSIRSFITQLAAGSRRNFRTQLRAVLTGSAAFHIRRLAAESFANQTPQDDDWPLIRELLENHRDMFQVIYARAIDLSWHYFWLRHLVPHLENSRDSEGIAAHVHRSALWKDDDTAGVVAFWVKALSTDWIENSSFARQLDLYLSQVSENNSALIAPILKELLKLPLQEHSFLGVALAHCISAGGLEDDALWQFIAGDINDENVLAYRMGNKLHCQPHEFGGPENKFISHRMSISTDLLDLAVHSLENWSHLRISKMGSWMARSSGFLGSSSYRLKHGDSDYRHIDGEGILLDAMESAIRIHAQKNSPWWRENRDRLCFSHEGALRYFAILACTDSPIDNIAPIERILCEQQFTKFDLSYECGALIYASFAHLTTPAQDRVLSALLTLRENEIEDEQHRQWIIYERVKLISKIPCYLRNPEAQALIDNHEHAHGPVDQQPFLLHRSGSVRPPFSFEIFLSLTDPGVLRLLRHYTGNHKQREVDFLIGGEREVGIQLKEATSRDPARFLNLLSIYWNGIPNQFCDDIVDGVAAFIARHQGYIQPDNNWKPVAEPNPIDLSTKLLDELERHPPHWHHNHSASNALEACAHVIQSPHDASRLAFLLGGFVNLQEESRIHGDKLELLTIGINMMRGHTAEAAMILASKLHEQNSPLPDILISILHCLAADRHTAIRALMLRRLPYLQSQLPKLGWKLFYLALSDKSLELWQSAEPCLYYAYHSQYDVVAPLLSTLYKDGHGASLETWGRISALSALSNHLPLSDLLNNLEHLNSNDAWHGAASVWTHHGNLKQHPDKCTAGISAGLSHSNPHSLGVAKQLGSAFHNKEMPTSIPTEIIASFFSIMESDDQNIHRDIFGFGEWLNKLSQHDPEQALIFTEMYLSYINRAKTYFYDHNNCLTQLLTRLFAEAEEKEAGDEGAMLQRVVALQDLMLSVGVNGVDEWLKAAERP